MTQKIRGSKIRVKFQGLCQGNEAVPASWAVISIVISTGAHKRNTHGAKFVCPVSLALAKALHISHIFFG